METKEVKRGLPVWAVRLMIWVLPALAMVLIAIFVLGLVPNLTSLPALIAAVLIGLVITRLIFLFRSERTAGAKVWRAVIWAIALIALIMAFLLSPQETYRCIKNNAQERFEASLGTEALEKLGAPMELGNVKATEYHFYDVFILVFESRANTLICSYDEADYEAEKAALETRYSYRTEQLYSGIDEKGFLEPYAEIGDYHFRFIYPNDNMDNEWAFFKQSILLATNDATHEIGYIVFQDIDLDEADDLTEFLNDYCGWKYIR